MISLIHGRITIKHKFSIVILTSSGVGYEVQMAVPELLKLPNSGGITLYTYLKVGENSMDLYGFPNEEQKNFFILLLSVSGVGPKTALNILSLGSIDEIQAAIGRGDVKYLTAVQGIGGKTAERMVVELKSKVESQKLKVDNVDSGVMADVIEGLVSMGYTREDAKQAVRGMETKGKTVQEVMKEALRKN